MSTAASTTPARSDAGPAAAQAKRTITIALVGNPNTGKTTLFNALCGMSQRVGNYPGVTVEKKVGTFRFEGTTFQLIDLPGTYSLAARSPDEMVTVNLLLGDQPGEKRPDLILNIVDASNLERNLFLTTQLGELGIPLVLAVNMVDVAAGHGIEVDFQKLQEKLGVPVVPIQAHRKIGLGELRRALAGPGSTITGHPAQPAAFQSEVQGLAGFLKDLAPSLVDATPALLGRLLIDVDGAVQSRYGARYGAALLERVREARRRLGEAGCGVPAVEARMRYGYLREQIGPLIRKADTGSENWSARIDRVVTHRFWGLVIFLGLLLVIFESLFAWAEPLKNALNDGIKRLGVSTTAAMADGPLKSLIEDGIFAGVGGVLVFLPQIMILFGFLAILEDCGYMARAAFLMDKVMARCGLSGKSFIPLLSSFACAIPGVMATRVIEDRRDRLATILVAPLMSCAARLPVYTLMIAAFVPNDTVLGTHLQGLVLFGMYMIGIVAAPLVAWVLKRTILRGETPIFMLELPPYKWPSAISVVHRMGERGWAFVKRAGTFILASMIVVWALLYFPRTDAEGGRYDERAGALAARLEAAQEPNATESAEAIEHEMAQVQAEWKRQSYLGRIGKALEPALEPLGWDWRIGTAALASFPAREVIVGVLGQIFGEEKARPLDERLQQATWEKEPGRKLFGLPTALSLMVFFALCCQCASTLAVIRRETNSWLWPLFTFAYMTALAYAAALVTFQVGSTITR
jgi:ferrous iron transport protein B